MPRKEGRTKEDAERRRPEGGREGGREGVRD